MAEMLDKDLLEAARRATGMQKDAFTPATAGGVPPGAPPPGAVPPGAPPPGAMPPDAAMAGAPAGMPPGAAPAGMPPDAAMAGAPPAGAQPIVVNLNDLVALFQQVAQSSAPGGQGANESLHEPTTTNTQIGDRLDVLEKKIDLIGELLSQLMGAEPSGGAVAPPGAGMSPEAVMGAPAEAGGVPPEALAGAPGAIGVGAAPETQTPPVMPPPPGMTVAASERQQSAAIAEMALKLRHK